jgi:hypothetical protein
MSSKFSAIIAARKGEADEQPDQLEDVMEEPTAPAKPKEKSNRKTTVSSTPAAPAQLDTPRRGRPAIGKRSDPNFEQVTAYIRRNTYQGIKIALLQEGDKRDFSDLTEELLVKWLKSHGK